MGHLRLGRLPKTRRWSEVVGLLDQVSPDDAPSVARATLFAAENRLRSLAYDPSVAYCFWLLVRLTWAARGDDFVDALPRLGLAVDPNTPTLSFISQLSDVVRSQLARHRESGPFSELALLALRRALSETVASHGASLFGSSVDDLRQAFRAYSTRRQFGMISRRFFSDFLARILKSFVDKEISNHVGESHGLSTIEASQEFEEALDLHTRQTGRILEEYAGGWYSKHNWESKGQITEEEAAGFVAVALRKLRAELKLQAG